MTRKSSSEPFNWFYIKSIATGHVFSANQDVDGQTDSSSQLYAYPQQRVDEELWCWDDQRLVNKATGLVLDISQERFRLLKDTELRLRNRMPDEEGKSQLWGIRQDEPDWLGRSRPGYILYAYHNPDWVIDIQVSSSKNRSKVILFPYQSIDNDHQRWVLESANADDDISDPTFSSDKNQSANESSPASPREESILTVPEFTSGLSPAKRKLQSSVALFPVAAYKEAHSKVYTHHASNVTHDTIAMAAAYEVWNSWYIKRTNPASSSVHRPTRQVTCTYLQAQARAEANTLLKAAKQPLNKREEVTSLAARLIMQLVDYADPNLF